MTIFPGLGEIASPDQGKSHPRIKGCGAFSILLLSFFLSINNRWVYRRRRY
jgi:hypothetical protein